MQKWSGELPTPKEIPNDVCIYIEIKNEKEGCKYFELLAEKDYWVGDVDERQVKYILLTNIAKHRIYLFGSKIWNDSYLTWIGTRQTTYMYNILDNIELPYCSCLKPQVIKNSTLFKQFLYCKVCKKEYKE